MKTSELTGALLDYWTGRADGKKGQIIKSNSPCNLDYFELASGTPFRPSTHWAHGGPLIDKYGLTVEPYPPAWWANEPGELATMGEAPLEAICRAVVRAKFGDEVPDQENAK